jgi:hypothetical protein
VGGYTNTHTNTLRTEVIILEVSSMLVEVSERGVNYSLGHS